MWSSGIIFYLIVVWKKKLHLVLSDLMYLPIYFHICTCTYYIPSSGMQLYNVRPLVGTYTCMTLKWLICCKWPSQSIIDSSNVLAFFLKKV